MKLTIGIIAGAAIGYLGSIYTSEVFVGIVCLIVGYYAAKINVNDETINYR